MAEGNMSRAWHQEHFCRYFNALIASLIQHQDRNRLKQLLQSWRDCFEDEPDHLVIVAQLEQRLQPIIHSLKPLDDKEILSAFALNDQLLTAFLSEIADKSYRSDR